MAIGRAFPKKAIKGGSGLWGGKIRKDMIRVKKVAPTMMARVMAIFQLVNVNPSPLISNKAIGNHNKNSW